MTKGRRLAVLGLALAVFVIALMVKEAYRGTPDPGQGSRPGAAGDAGSQEAALPRLIDLGAGQCIPCKMMAPILQELKQEYAGQFVVDVIDVRDNRSAGIQYGIRVIPTQIFISPAGEELYRHEGFMSKEAILAKWKELGVDVDSRDSSRRKG